MPSDLYYFYESDLNEGSLGRFIQSLPTQELKDKFVKSMGGLKYVDRSVTNVLQGYRGPHTDGSSGDSSHLEPSHGLQEVRYWWGATKLLHFIPVVGTIAWSYCRFEGNTDWHNIYFDSNTGECLSDNKEIAASKLNEIGKKLFQSAKFSEAKEYFRNALANSSNSTNSDKYRENRNEAQVEIDAINLNSEGDHLFHKGKYAEARAKYKAAYNKSKVKEQYEVYKSNRDEAQAEIYAINLNSEGDQLFHQGKYAEAKTKYQAAYDKSKVKEQYEVYKSNRDEAQVEIDALTLNSEGDQLFNQGKFAKAKAKYEAAYSRSNNRKHCELYKCNIDRAQAGNDALNLNIEGDQLLYQGKYAEAKAKYEAAYSRSNNSKHCEIYKINMDVAQAENDALKFNSEGDQLLHQGKYVEAKTKYQAAYEKSIVSKQREIYKSNIEKAQAENDALKFNSEGDQLFQQGKYSEAKERYHVAYDKSKNETQRTKYASKMEKALAEAAAMKLNQEGLNCFNEGRYADAIFKFQEAYDTSLIRKEYIKYGANRNNAISEQDSMVLKELADKDFKAGRYDIAKTKYQEACDKSSVSVNKSIYLRCVYEVDAHINAVEKFNLVVTECTSETELKTSALQLHDLADYQYGNVPPIVNRLLAVSRRIEWMRKSGILQKCNAENRGELIKKLLSIMEDLKSLDTIDENLEVQLTSFINEIRALNEIHDFQNDGLSNVVSIAVRIFNAPKVLKTEKKDNSYETLSQEVNLVRSK